MKYGIRCKACGAYIDMSPLNKETMQYHFRCEHLHGKRNEVWVTCDLWHGKNTDARWLIKDRLDCGHVPDLFPMVGRLS